MSQSSHINSNIMNSSMSSAMINSNPGGGAGDPGQNENENHLIGNILAEEDEYNSGSDIEESKLLSATTGAGANYINNANNSSSGGSGSGTSNNAGGGVGSSGFGQLTGKLTGFAAGAGAFGLPGSSPYGGAFSNSAISISNKVEYGIMHSPSAKKIGAQNQPSGFSNLFTSAQDPFSQGSTLDPLIRRPSTIMDQGFTGTGQNQAQSSDTKQMQLNIQSLLSPIGTSGNSTGSAQGGSSNFNSDNPNSTINGQQAFLDINSTDANQSNIYTTKEYYDYFHSLKVRDPRLPPPQYMPTQAEINEQALKNAQNNQDEIEKKLSQLTLSQNSMDQQNTNIGIPQSQNMMSAFAQKTQPYIMGQPQPNTLEQPQLPFPLQQYPINPMLFGQPQLGNISQQPPSAVSHQSAQALLQQLAQQHIQGPSQVANSTGASSAVVSSQLSQQQNATQPGNQGNNNTATTQSNQGGGSRSKKGKKGGGAMQEPPPMPKPPGQQQKANQQVMGNTQTQQNQQQQQNRMGMNPSVGTSAFGAFPHVNQFGGNNQMLGGMAQQTGQDNKIAYQGWPGGNLSQQNANPFNFLNNASGPNVSQNLHGSLMALTGQGNNPLNPGAFSSGLNTVGQGLAQQNMFNQNGAFTGAQQNFLNQNSASTGQIQNSSQLFGAGDQQQQAALLMQNYAAMGMQNPYAAAMIMNRMMQAQMYPSGGSQVPAMSPQYPMTGASTNPGGFGGPPGFAPLQTQINSLPTQNNNIYAGGNISQHIQGDNNSNAQYSRKGNFNQMSQNQAHQMKGSGPPPSSGGGMGRGRGGMQSHYSMPQGSQGGRGGGINSYSSSQSQRNDYNSNPLYHQHPLGRGGDNQNQYGIDPMDQGMPGGIIQQAKSEFLEDLRNKIQNGKKIEIKEIKDHVVECSMDQYGSRFIQQKYDVTNEEEKELIFAEILPEAYSLMNDVFGNYVVQKLFEYGTDQQRATLAEQLLGNVLKLTKSMYGCRVVQKALEVISLEQKKLLVQELKDAVVDCIYDQNGNHVIQKCIEKMPCEQVDFIVQTIIDKPGQVKDLCLHTYGCRVIQRILEKCHESQTNPIIDAILIDIAALTKDQFGNYVIQHILEQGRIQEDKNRIVKSIKGRVIELSNHKFASNVVEKCLQHGSENDKKTIIDEFLESNYELAEEITNLGGPQLNGALYTMMKDRYGNYVIQKCIEVSKGKQREILIKKITACANVLRKQQNYSRHVYNFIEKFCPPEGSEAANILGDSNNPIDMSQYQNHNGGGGGRGRGNNQHYGHNSSTYGGTNYSEPQNMGGYTSYTQHHHSSSAGGGGPHYVQKKQQPGGSSSSQKRK